MVYIFNFCLFKFVQVVLVNDVYVFVVVVSGLANMIIVFTLKLYNVQKHPIHSHVIIYIIM